MLDISKRLLLRSITIQMTMPDRGEKKGTVTYDATFEIEWNKNSLPLTVTVSTEEGWEAAKHLACEQVKELAKWLDVAAEHEKTGPHVPHLY